MSVESATYISDLNPLFPTATDGMKEGDDHLRLMKAVLQATFPNLDAAVTAEPEKLNNGAVPTGTIVLWYSTSGTIPTGWTYCNGVEVAKMDGSGNITPPDLRDKFVVGAGSTFTQGSSGGSTTTSSNGAHTHTVSVATDGSHTHGGTTGATTLTTAQIPAHTHFLFANVTGSVENEVTASEQAANGLTSQENQNYLIYGTATAATTGLSSSSGGGGSHTHTISSTGSTHTHSATVDSQGAHTHTVTPPYYALVYMMRK